MTHQRMRIWLWLRDAYFWWVLFGVFGFIIGIMAGAGWWSLFAFTPASACALAITRYGRWP